MVPSRVKVTVLYECPFWVGIFERKEESQRAVARQIFGCDPTTEELQEFLLTHYYLLRFKEPQDDIQLEVIRR